MSSGGGGGIADDNANSGNGGSAMITPDEVDAVFRRTTAVNPRRHRARASRSKSKVPGLTGDVPAVSRQAAVLCRERRRIAGVMSTLKSWHEAEPDRQPSLQPSGLLVDTVQGCSTLRRIYYKSESG